MEAIIKHPSGDYSIDFSKPIDISIHTNAENHSSRAWYVDPIKIEIIRTDQFVGSVAEGGSTNFRNIHFNPHGNTTHTECVGHIANEVFDINKSLKQYFHKAQLISIQPERVETEYSEWVKKDDLRITFAQIKSISLEDCNTLIIRTLPNQEIKKNKNWSSTNWAYLEPEAASYLASKGIEHLLIDLPSVDREFDGGALLAHHAFWNYPNNTRMNATITEMIFVPDNVKDGIFFINLQPASFVNDASPCRPVIYEAKNCS